MTRKRAGIAVLLAVGAVMGCSRLNIDLEGRVCTDEGCVEGFACHPEQELCVPAIEVGCDGPPAVCPSETDSRTHCSAAGSFIPCLDGVEGCDQGCRTCGADGLWSNCSLPFCVLGSTETCASCTDDCTMRVLNAAPQCDVDTCDYSGSCATDTVDLDGDRTNGCECTVAPETCNDTDDNCDGTTDEGFGLGAPCGLGQCVGGATECATPSTTRCSTMPGGSEALDSLEVCDGVDNDCDAATDEDFACRAGELVPCDAGGGPTSGRASCDPSTCTFGACVANWWNTDYDRRLQLIFDNTGRAALSTFPVLVVLDDTIINYGNILPGGDDLRFVDPDQTTVLPYEIDTWDDMGVSTIWVQVPSLDADSASDHIWMYFQHSGAAAGQVPAAVWDGNFGGVWHLREDAAGTGTAGLYVDSTINPNDGDDEVATTQKAGWIGAGQGLFADDFIRVPDHASLGATAGVTLEVWAETTTEGWRYARDVTLSTATTRDNYPVRLQFDSSTFDFSRTNGNDLRFFLPDGTALDYFIRRWRPIGVTEIWLRMPTAGADRALMFYGNALAGPASDPAATLPLWEDFESYGGQMDGVIPAGWTDYRNGTVELDTEGGGNRVGIKTANSDPDGGYVPFTASPALTDFQMVVRTQKVSSAGGALNRYTVGTLNGSNAQGYGPNVNWGSSVALTVERRNDSNTPALGSDTVDTVTNAWYTLTLNKLGNNFTLRLHDSTGTLLGTATGSDSTYSTFDHVFVNGGYAFWTDDILVRPFTNPDPLASVGPERVVGVGKPHAYGIRVDGAGVEAQLNDQRVGAPFTAADHYIALAYDGTTIRLYVDGAQVDAAPYPMPVAVTAADFLMGDRLAYDAIIDEVRVSVIGRSADWVAAQNASLRNTLITYGMVELRP